MALTIKMTATLSKADVEKMVRDVFAREAPEYNVESVDFKLGMSGGDYRDDGYSVFTGVDVRLKPKTGGQR